MILEGHTDKVTCLKAYPEGKVVFSGSIDGTIQVWNHKQPSPIRVIEVGKPVTCLEIVEGQLFVGSLTDSEILIYDISVISALFIFSNILV
jgi:WD40 repeat protein